MRARWMLLLAAVPALVRAGPATGWIEGTVSIRGDQDVWVYVDDPDGPLPATPAVATLAQRGTRFVPSTLVVPRGTTVDFPNEGPEQHNVHWVTPDDSRDLGTYRAGESEQHVFEVPGTYPIGCRRHDTMSATIKVVPNTWVTKVDPRTGRFRIDGVTPGPHVVVAWSARRAGAYDEVVVEPGRGATFELALGAR